MMATLGDNIRAERTRRRLTAEELGTAAGITGQTVLTIERGEVSPRIDTVQKIADALELSVASLLPTDAAPLSPQRATEIDRASHDFRDTQPDQHREDRGDSDRPSVAEKKGTTRRKASTSH